MTSTALIVVRCFNDAWVVGATLDAVFAQQGPSFRVVAIDSGSTDGSVGILRRYPLELHRIQPGSYVPGRVLNQGMELGDEPYGVFVNSDCTPQHREWLAELLEPFETDARVAAVYGRQVPRPDAHPLVVKDYERAFGDGTVASGWGHFFSMASSAIRRSVWRESPFDPDIRYSEDVHWSWQRRQEGWRIAYAPRSVAMHSHNYTVSDMRRRYHGEGRADARIYPRSMLPSSWLRAVPVRAGAEIVRDLRWCLRGGHLRALLDSPVHRLVQRHAYWRGLRSALATHDGT